MMHREARPPHARGDFDDRRRARTLALDRDWPPVRGESLTLRLSAARAPSAAAAAAASQATAVQLCSIRTKQHTEKKNIPNLARRARMKGSFCLFCFCFLPPVLLLYVSEGTPFFPTQQIRSEKPPPPRPSHPRLAFRNGKSSGKWILGCL